MSVVAEASGAGTDTYSRAKVDARECLVEVYRLYGIVDVFVVTNKQIALFAVEVVEV